MIEKKISFAQSIFSEAYYEQQRKKSTVKVKPLFFY